MFCGLSSGLIANETKEQKKKNVIAMEMEIEEKNKKKEVDKSQKPYIGEKMTQKLLKKGKKWKIFISKAKTLLQKIKRIIKRK